MIVRIWHGWTTPANADRYERLLREEIFVGIGAQKIEGYLGIAETPSFSVPWNICYCMYFALSYTLWHIL